MKQNILKIKAQSFHSVKVIWFLALRIGPEPWWSDLWQLLSVLRWGFIPELQSDSFHTDHHRQRILVYLKIWHTSWETDQTLQGVSVRIFSSWRKKNICWTSFRLFQWYLYLKKKNTRLPMRTQKTVCSKIRTISLTQSTNRKCWQGGEEQQKCPVASERSLTRHRRSARLWMLPVAVILILILLSSHRQSLQNQVHLILTHRTT